MKDVTLWDSTGQTTDKKDYHHFLSIIDNTISKDFYHTLLLVLTFFSLGSHYLIKKIWCYDAYWRWKYFLRNIYNCLGINSEQKLLYLEIKYKFCFDKDMMFSWALESTSLSPHISIDQILSKCYYIFTNTCTYLV